MKRARQKPSALLHDLRIAAVRKARQEHSAYIAECVFFEASEERSEVVPVRDQANGLEHVKRWISARGECSATDAAAQRVLAEGGFYRQGFKLKLETTEWYALLYDVKIDVADT
ncbi:MAG: hypothetical protein ABSD75_32730 [Terriglobales bacterium]|jgi:hypothetical protein